MSRRRRIVATVVLAVVAMVITACTAVTGDPEGTQTGDVESTNTTGTAAPAPTSTVDADAAPAVSLDGIRLATDSAPQLGQVRIDGLDPEHARGVIAAYEFDDGSWWATPVLLDADGPYLIAPLFPKDIDAGGSHDLIFTDGVETASHPVPLTVGPLAPAPGAYQEAVDVGRQLVGELAAAMGGDTVSDWNSLVALEAEETPSHLLGLKFAQMLFDDEIIAEADTLPAAERDLLDAIFGAADVPALLDHDAMSALLATLPEQIAEASAEPGDVVIDDDPAGTAPSDDDTGTDDPEAGGTGTGDTGPDDGADDANGAGENADEQSPAGDGPVGFRSPQSGALPAAAPSGATCIPLNLGGSVSAGELSALMIDSAVSAIAVDPNGSPAKIMAVLEGALLVGSGLEIAATGGATVHGSIGAFATGLKTLHEARAGIYPSAFTKIDVTIDPERFDEDHPFEEPGHWTSVKVLAMSTGHGFDQAVFDAVTSAGSSLLGGIKEVGGGVDWKEELVHFATEERAKKLLGEDLEKLPDVLHSCPETWSSDIAGADWTWARPLEGLFTVDNNDQSYHNWKEVGEDALAIGPLPHRFGQKSIYQYLPVRTDELEVLAGSAGGARTNVLYVSSPGDPVDITAHIVNAYNPEMQWTATQGEWADSGGTVTTSTEEEATKRLITPERAEDFGDGGIHVRIESMSRTGLRESGNPPRYDFVRVRLAPFIVEPTNGQVLPERELTYTAIDREGKPVDVEWQATGGTIVKTGVGTATYTAGKNIGAYEVTAIRGSGGPDNTVTVPVRIVDDHCIVGEWELNSGPFVDALLAAAGSGDLPADVSMTYSGGTYRVFVDSDGTTMDVRTDWTITMEGDGLSLDIIMNGTETGTWHIDPSEDDPNSGSLTVETTGGSINVQFRSPLGPVPFGNQQVPSEPAMGSGSYACSVDTLELVVNADGHQIPATWFRVSGSGSEDGS